jgi:hypothetical protein
MKKVILLSVSILVLIFACSKDDDGPTGGSSADLIGTWNLDYYVQNGKLTEEIICDELVEYVFSSNGTYKVTTFSGSTTKNCATAVQISGTWEDVGSNDYQLTPNGGTAGPALSITFQDNFKKFSSEVNTSRTEVYAKK